MVYIEFAIVLTTNLVLSDHGFSGFELRRTASMKIEKRLLHSQFQDWLNLQVARHLEAQASKFRVSSSVDGAETIQIKAHTPDADRMHA
jgi:hypothetical protein